MKHLHKILKILGLVIIFLFFIVSLFSSDLNYKISGNEEVNFHYMNEITTDLKIDLKMVHVFVF